MDYGIGRPKARRVQPWLSSKAGPQDVVGGRSPAWCSGWEDADTDRLKLSRYRKVVDEGLEESYEAPLGVLFDAGREARLHGISFDEGRTQPWQAGWVKTDSSVGVSGIEG